MVLFFLCPLAYWALGVRALRRGRSGELHKGDRGKEKKSNFDISCSAARQFSSAWRQFLRLCKNSKRQFVDGQPVYGSVSRYLFALHIKPSAMFKAGVYRWEDDGNVRCCDFGCLGLGRKKHSGSLVFWRKAPAAVCASPKVQSQLTSCRPAKKCRGAAGASCPHFVA